MMARTKRILTIEKAVESSCSHCIFRSPQLSLVLQLDRNAVYVFYFLIVTFLCEKRYVKFILIWDIVWPVTGLEMITQLDCRFLSRGETTQLQSPIQLMLWKVLCISLYLRQARCYMEVEFCTIGKVILFVYKSLCPSFLFSHSRGSVVCGHFLQLLNIQELVFWCSSRETKIYEQFIKSLRFSGSPTKFSYFQICLNPYFLNIYIKIHIA